MNIAGDMETRIVGFGLTQSDAMKDLQFNLERSGKLSASRLERRKEIHAWLPKPNLLHVKGIGAILYDNNFFINLQTQRKVRARIKPLSHYLCLFSAFDGKLSYEDFTITISPEVNKFLGNISDKFLQLCDFPYIKPVEDFKIKNYHRTVIPDMAVCETYNNSIVLSTKNHGAEVDLTPGADNDSLLAYLLAADGYVYDGYSIKECLHD